MFQTENAEMGEFILNEKYLTITFRFGRKGNIVDETAWYGNGRSLDELNPRLRWIGINLAQLSHNHRVYEMKRKRSQSLASKKPSLRRVLAKYSKKDGDGAKGFIHKLATRLAGDSKVAFMG